MAKRKLPTSVRNATCPRCGQRLDSRFVTCSCVTPNADPIKAPPPRGAFRSFDELTNVPTSQWTDGETVRYVGFLLESAAHLSGGFGALTPRHCLALAERVGRVGSGQPHDPVGAVEDIVERLGFGGTLRMLSVVAHDWASNGPSARDDMVRLSAALDKLEQHGEAVDRATK